MIRSTLLLTAVLTLMGCIDLGDNDGNTSPTPTPSPIFEAMVTNNADPTTTGPGVASVWNYQGLVGVAAGDAMCVAVGSDHICTYAEVVAAEAQGDFSAVIATTFWIHRVNEEVMIGQTPSQPGAGGRCVEWETANNTLADGEYAELQGSGITYHFDDDTIYDNTPDHSQPGLLECTEPRAIACCAL